MDKERGFLRKRMLDYKRQITLPTNYWFKKTDNSIVFAYFIGSRMHFITLETREKVAEFLKKHNIINRYEGLVDNVKMYARHLRTVAGKDGQPINWNVEYEIGWNAIDFKRSDVIHFACENEVLLQGGEIGIGHQILARVYELCNHVFQAA